MAKAVWTTGKPVESLDANGTVTASLPLLDAGVLTATLEFTMTADRVLTVVCKNEPGTPGLSGFQAWSTGA